MPERPIDASNVKGIQPSTIVETRDQKKARLAQVYDRGVVGDRLHVDLPPELHGEWVANVNTEIQRKESLGFRIDTEYARKRALHDNGTSSSIVGDVVFMVCDREQKEILDEVRRDRYEKTHGTVKGKQVEERTYAANVRGNDPAAPIVDSNVKSVKGGDITNAIRSATNNQ